MRNWRRVVSLILVVVPAAAVLWPRGGATVPLHAARTGLKCQSCHFDPNGGGPRTELGFGFGRSRHSLEPEDSTSRWADLALVNRVGDSFPLYIGVNHRFMLLANQTDPIPGIDRVGFFNMENALHVAFQPHANLTLVYTRDGFDDGSKSQDAFGMIGGGPWGSYLKAGRFRNPFGLRMDDHTVATRNGFLDFQGSPFGAVGYLPYDPRVPDMGVEVGGDAAGFFGRASFTNGGSHPFVAPFGNARAQAKALKLGYDGSWYHGGFSFYDDFRHGPPLVDSRHRATRWAYYGMLAWRPFALIGEIGAGTDEFVAGGKNNMHAGFVELDVAPLRWLNFRARYDRLNLGQLGTPEDIVYDRYALEGEVVPVPFAELRWTLRRIEPEAGEKEDQAYLQFHFSY
jgi:hypothetical protein